MLAIQQKDSQWHKKITSTFSRVFVRTLGSFIRRTASDIASQLYYASHSVIVLRTVSGE